MNCCGEITKNFQKLFLCLCTVAYCKSFSKSIEGKIVCSIKINVFSHVYFIYQQPCVWLSPALWA